MAKVVVFGLSDCAQLAKYYLDNDSEHEVVAFTASSEYIHAPTFEGLNVVPWAELERSFPPTEFHLFVPMTATAMNKNRRRVYEEGKARGYRYISYVSSHATVLTDEIGENCFIMEDNTLQPFVRIGNNVVLWSGNHIGHHSTIRDHVFFTSHVVLSGHVEVGEHAYLGVNATIRDNIEIAEGTLIAMGSNVTRSTEPWKAYVGNPAKALDRGSLEVYR
jgi:sugar O-acyltransferase (sialic acid O-acetyltransferase NeuD family)